MQITITIPKVTTVLRSWKWALLALLVLTALLVPPPREVQAQPIWQEVVIPNLPTGAVLVDVWASGKNDVYVTAHRTTPATTDVPEGFVFHWDGASWSEVLHLPATFLAFGGRRKLFGTGASDVFVLANECAAGRTAGCDGGRIWRSTDGGTTWTPQTLPAGLGNGELISISGTAGNVHVVARPGLIIRFDGSSWSTIFTDTTHAPNAVTVLSANEGYYVTCFGWGSWDGTSWQYNGNQFDFCDVQDAWGTRDGGGALHLYTVGNNNFSNGVRVWKFDQALNSFVSKCGFVFGDPTTGGFICGGVSAIGSARAIWGSAADDIYVVGQILPGPNDGRVYHYDGTAWAQVTAVGDIPHAQSVWGTASDDVWVTAAGPNSTKLLHFAPPSQINITNLGQYALPKTCFDVRDAAQNPLFQVCDNDFQDPPASHPACDDGTDTICNDEDPADGLIRVTTVAGDYRVVVSKPAVNHTADPNKQPCAAVGGGKCDLTFVNTPGNRPWFPWDLPEPKLNIEPDGRVNIIDIGIIVRHFMEQKPLP